MDNMDFKKLFPIDLYHSYVIESSIEETPYLLLKFLEERGDVEKQSSDILIEKYDSFAILDGQKIKEWHQNKSIGEGKKICIISTKFINREAEQSLLKIIEEPNNQTHFFIIVPDSSLLLDTIMSRVHLVKITQKDIQISDSTASEFLNFSLPSRIEKVAEIIKEFKDSENSGGLRFRAISLINGIEKNIYEKWKKDLNNENYKFILEELKNSRDYLGNPGASVKMILEHIALVISN
jgi:Cft2 family RNA processing exonuclease